MTKPRRARTTRRRPAVCRYGADWGAPPGAPFSLRGAVLDSGASPAIQGISLAQRAACTRPLSSRFLARQLRIDQRQRHPFLVPRLLREGGTRDRALTPAGDAARP